jgi:hypothetical protein
LNIGEPNTSKVMIGYLEGSRVKTEEAEVTEVHEVIRAGDDEKDSD